MSKKNDKQKKRDPKAVEMFVKEGESEQSIEATLAKTYLRPTVMAAATIKGQYSKNDDVNINALINELSVQVSKVNNGDLGRAEAMLIAQAHTLDALFAELVSRARTNMGEHLPAAMKYMSMGLKAQGQCRTTIEALVEIKNPRPYIQNNKAQYQQVNNGVPVPHAHGENSKVTNELLTDGSNDYATMDTGRAAEIGRTDKEMEAVGAKHRGEN